MPDIPIQFPGSYAAGHAIAFSDSTGNAQLVDTRNPLPIATPAGALLAVAVTPPATVPLTGVAAASGTMGPFAPVVGRSVMLNLWGDWSGSVQITRSTDQGATRLPLTIGGGVWGLFTTNCCEQVWDESEASAQLYLNITLTAGAVNYRLAQ